MGFVVGKKYMIKDKSLSDFCGCTVEEGDVYECHEVVPLMTNEEGD